MTTFCSLINVTEGGGGDRFISNNKSNGRDDKNVLSEQCCQGYVFFLTNNSIIHNAVHLRLPTSEYLRKGYEKSSNNGRNEYQT